MRIGIITDSACDLPNDFIEREQIVILPVTIQIGPVSYTHLDVYKRQLYHLAR